MANRTLNVMGNPIPFMKNQDPVGRGHTYFVTENEYYSEGLNKDGKAHKSIEFNGVKYYYTANNISDKNAKILAETHPGGASPSLIVDPGGRKSYSKTKAQTKQYTTNNTINTTKPAVEYKGPLLVQGLDTDQQKFGFINLGVPVFNRNENLDVYDYNINELVDDRRVFGLNANKHKSDKNKREAVNNYYSQVKELENAIVNGVTSNPDFYEKFSNTYPEVEKPYYYIGGSPVYRTDEQKNDFFYKTLYDYYYNSDLNEEGISTPSSDLTPTQIRVKVQNGLIDNKLEEVGILTSNNKKVISGLSPEGKIALMGSGYLSPYQIDYQVENYVKNNELPAGAGDEALDWAIKTGIDLGITAAGVFTKSSGVAAYGAISTISDVWNHPYSVSLARFISKDYREATYKDARASLEAHNQNILKAIVDADNVRKEALAEEDAKHIYDMYEFKLRNNRISEGDVVKDFNTIVSSMPHYAGIVNLGSNEFDNYPIDSMISDISKYAAVNNILGPESAYMMLDAKFQNYVSDQQDGWDYVGNTFMGFCTEFVSTLGNTITAIPSVVLGGIDTFADTDYLAQYLGKSRNDIGALLYPSYYSDISQYNTFNYNDIQKIKQAGGVSPYTNIRPVGDELSIASWYTLGDVIEQGGQLAGMSTVGMGSRYGLGKIGRLGDRTKNIIASATSAIGGAQAEAVGTYKEAVESLNRTLDGVVDAKFNEYRDYELNKYVNSEQYDKDVSDLYEELRSNLDSTESDTTTLNANLMLQAENQVKGTFLLNLKNSIDSKYQEARDQIGRYAVGSYSQAFLLNGIKTTLTNSIVLKNVFYKPMNRPSIQVKSTYENNRLKLLTPKIKHYGMYAQRVGNMMLTEYLDEYADGLFNDWAILTGNDTYSRYLAEKYDMGAYVSNSSNWFSGLLTQGAKTFSNRFQEQYIFEGAIGALSAGNVNVNFINAYKAMRGKSLLTEEELKHNLAITNRTDLTDQQKASMLVDLTVMEKAGRIFGGAIGAMAEVDTEIRNSLIEGTAAAENITKYWDNFLESTDLVSKLLAAKYSEGGSVLDMKNAYDDLRLALAVSLAQSEDQLTSSGIELQQLKELKELLRRAAEGDITEEDIDKFINNPDNKAFIQSLGN